ncbi:conserved hypothetical protein [Vibrio nigripulchritudo SOn1]|uniref:Uncharacterized protein n=1 Tax=Vibrio nigripulchritudo SOn1 TaxID=1238450 RepID=A0AAV2VMJ8_9VIBR|nr:conserved hypothetical protein [Vibrio nigripulchritudo SOn1]
MNKTLSQLSPASPLLSVLLKMKGQIDNKVNANDIYRDLYPVLEELLMKGYRFESAEIQGLVSILSELPAWGARRIHFRKTYLKDIYTLKKLPRDPRNIPSGLWH